MYEFEFLRNLCIHALAKINVGLEYYSKMQDIMGARNYQLPSSPQ